MVNAGCPRWVVIVDDEAPMRHALLDLLDEAGFTACAFASGEEFLASGRQYECWCLITDIRMPGMSGLDLQCCLKAERLRIPIIFITAGALLRRCGVSGETVRRRGLARYRASSTGAVNQGDSHEQHRSFGLRGR